jgi:hypothetical protein
VYQNMEHQKSADTNMFVTQPPSYSAMRQLGDSEGVVPCANSCLRALAVVPATGSGSRSQKC